MKKQIINNITFDNIVFDEYIYQTNDFGKIKILKWDGTRNIRGEKLFTVQFENTNNLKDNVRLESIQHGSVVDYKLLSYKEEQFYNTVYENKKSGKFKVLKGEEYIDITEKGERRFSVQFLNTMNIRRGISKQLILSGKVLDIDHIYDFIFNKIHKSHSFGEFKVLSYEGNSMYKIMFLKTGTIKVVSSKMIYREDNKYVKDPYCPNAHNIGYTGIITDNFKEYDKLYIALQIRWNTMLSRCYDIFDYHYKLYGAKGVTVCKRWHCFANYYNDVQQLPGFDKEKIMARNSDIHLDKDYICDQLIKEGKLTHKIYAPETCIWISNSNNTLLSNGKEVKIDLTHRIETESDLKFVINPTEQQEHFNNYMRARIMREHYKQYGTYYPYDPNNKNLIQEMKAVPLIRILPAES